MLVTLWGPAPNSAHTRDETRQAIPAIYFWENQISPSLISFSPDPQLIRPVFNLGRFGPPRGFTLQAKSLVSDSGI